MRRFKTPLILLCTMAVAVAGVWLLGSAAIRRPDADPATLMTGAVFSYLRDGAQFELQEAYPREWETARFVTSSTELSRWEQRMLFEYDARFAEADSEPLLLLWQDMSLVAAIPMPSDRNDYPRFVDAMGSSSFELAREDARFVCAFIADESGRGGYYECRALGGDRV